MSPVEERLPQTAAPCDAPHLAASRKAALMGARTVEAIAETFRVLGDPTRVRILDALSAGELCVCDIAALVGTSESAASHQLRLLRGMRLVRPRRAGRLVYYAVDDQHILELLKQASTHVEEPQLATRGSRVASLPDPRPANGKPRTAIRATRPANGNPSTGSGLSRATSRDKPR